jgi:hypothetical protein
MYDFTNSGASSDGYSVSPTLLPWEYYFVSNKYNNDWQVDGKMNGSGPYTYTFSSSAYSGNNFAWGSGDAFKGDGTINDWSKVFRAATSGDGYHWVVFQTYTYNNIGKGNENYRWHVPPTAASGFPNYITESDITITYTPSDNRAVISCTKSATIGDAGYITYSNSEKCTISGATAYKVSANNSTTVTLTEMSAETVWPENEGMILKGNKDDIVTISSVEGTASASSIGTNYLVGIGNKATNVTATTNTYVFAKDDTNGVGFYKASENGELAAHKAYLDLGKNVTAREFLSFSFNDETGINEVSAANNSDAIYNLQGVRQNQLQKGLNIVNGKKVLVK